MRMLLVQHHSGLDCLFFKKVSGRGSCLCWESVRSKWWSRRMYVEVTRQMPADSRPSEPYRLLLKVPGIPVMRATREVHRKKSSD